MARSNVLVSEFLSEMRHEVNQARKSKELPNQLLMKWTYKDMCQDVLRLGGHINQLFRKNGTVSIQDNLGVYEATATHAASTVADPVISGFTGLTPDALIGASIMTVVSDVFYTAQITDNDATTITISLGTDLPVMSDDPVMITGNNSKYSALLTGLQMIEYAEPIWQVLDGSEEPIEEIDVEEARNIKNDPMHANEAYFYKLGQSIQFAVGTSKVLSGDFTVGYYELPTEPTALDEYIDFPKEWQDLVQQRVMIRVLRKLGEIDRAMAKEADLESKWKELESANLNAPQIDRSTGERK